MKLLGLKWLVVLAVGGAMTAVGCAFWTHKANVVSSHSYRGHENDADIQHFVNAYQNTAGTRLDDCQTCHAAATLPARGKSVTKNACDFCHLVQHPDSNIRSGQPTTFADTLNSYGKDYLEAGRNAAAIQAIARQDSDGDGAMNQDEISNLKYPGDPASKPGQELAPMKVFTIAQLKTMPAHEQFMLVNASSQQHDFYAQYRGVKIKDLLSAAGVDPTDPNITSITVISPDGYLKDIPASRINQAYPAGVFHGGLDSTGLGPTCGFVQYPGLLPPGVADGAVIPGEAWLMLGYERDGAPVEVCTLDQTSGKINGEGPLRIIVPQLTPAAPDRGSQHPRPECTDGFGYDSTKDHNSGDMVRGVIAIRVNPLPAGLEDFDYRYGGWAFIDAGKVLVYGYGITAGN